MLIAVLLTTFNRKAKTLACLQSLKEQRLPQDVRLEIFLTDDASKDGTAEAVKQQFPEVHVLHGTGFLYWAGGMRFTWSRARDCQPDHYLLLNDDTVLSTVAIASLLETAADSEGRPAIAVGSTRDESSGQASYGGWKLSSRWFWKSERVPEAGEVSRCDFANANILLVPRQVVDSIGILAPHFTHSLADYDYTIRATRAGFAVQVAPGYLGACVDDHGNNWRSQKASFRERLHYLKSPKGLAYTEYLRFIRDHFPFSYPSAFCKLWMKTFFPFLWESFKKKPENKQA